MIGAKVQMMLPVFTGRLPLTGLFNIDSLTGVDLEEPVTAYAYQDSECPIGNVKR